MKKVLTICPSIRPQRLKEMYASFQATNICSDLIIDTKPGTTTEIINQAFKENPGYEFYHIANDDFIYHTPRWDQTLQTDGIGYANDGFMKDALCTISIIKGDWARALGWLQMPKLEFLYGDSCWHMIGENVKKLYYFPEVYIQHKHMIKEVFSEYDDMLKNLELEDDVYRKTNSQEQYKKDGMAYAVWLINQSQQDIEKIRKVL